MNDDWGSLEQPPDHLPHQILDFRWQGFEPHLLVSDGLGQPHTLQLNGQLDLFIGRSSSCVGRWREGIWMPCPTRTPTEMFHQCQRCAAPDVQYLQCVFEPRCEPGTCVDVFCARQHVVYLALLGEFPKIGMTSSRRFRQRVIEQGADGAAVIRHCRDRADARWWEKNLARLTGIPQLISPQQFMMALTQKVDDPAQILTGLIQEYAGEVEPMLRIIAAGHRYPLPAELSSAPQIDLVPGLHRGRIIGMKGKYIIYHYAGLRALDLSATVGRALFLPGLDA